MELAIEMLNLEAAAFTRDARSKYAARTQAQRESA